MIPGITVFLGNKSFAGRFKGRNVAFLGHEASVDEQGRSTLYLLAQKGIKLVCAFGPQHGLNSEKQDNMIESEDFTDSHLGIPVFSLYGKVRRPTQDMLDMFDVLIVDLQDLGVRVYTYITTLFYMIDACNNSGKEVWILDRPNPLGRPVEGLFPGEGWDSFICPARIVMRYGLTIGELASWYIRERNYGLDFHLIPMEGYKPEAEPGYGWPVLELPWVNPSPNASGLNMARCYPGTCLIEGTTLSEGRGTTHPLEMAGAPELDIQRILNRMKSLQADWMNGVILRPCHFEPVFDKHAGKLCHGIQIHTDVREYDAERFKPFRLIALLLKSLCLEYPDYPLWREGEFEYESERLAFDLLAGSDFLRKWIDDPESVPGDLEHLLQASEKEWKEESGPFHLY